MTWRSSCRANAALAAILVTFSPCAAAAATLSFGVVSPDVKVRPADTPATTPSATLRAAKNEFEPFQIVFTSSGGPTSGVSVTLSKSLTGPGGATIPDKNVVLYAERYYQVGTPSNSEGAAGRWPDPLVPNVDTFFGEKRNAFPFDVPGTESRVVWVDILVPAGAAAGDYSGELAVEVGGTQQGTVPIALHVGTFSLPSTATFTTAFGMGWDAPCLAHYGNNSCDTSWNEPKANALRELYLRAALDDRFTISDSDYQPPFGGSQAPYEQYVMPLVDGTGPTRLKGAKLTAIRLDGGDSSVGQWITYAKSKGFFDRLFYYPIDEPGSNQSQWNSLIASAQALHSADANARIIITSDIDEATSAGATSDIDIFVPVINYLDDKSGNTYAGNQRPKYDSWLAGKSNRLLWSYQSCMSHGCGNCGDATTDSYFTGWPQMVIDSTGVQDRAFPWVAFDLDVTGELYFDTTHQLTTAWDPDGQCDFSGSGDGTIFYPGKPSVIGGTKDIPIESIRMKLIREGMEDYEYLVQAAKKDSAKAHQIASTLFPHPWDTHKTAADLENARNELFDMLDTPGTGGSGGAGGSGGTSGTGGATTGGSGGIDGGAAAGGSSGSAGKSPGSSKSGGCGCRTAGGPTPGDASWLLFPLAWLVVRRRCWRPATRA